MEHGKLCDWRNWQKDALRNEIQKHQVQKPKTGAKAKRQRPETESCIRAVGRMQLSSVCTLLPHMLRSCANDNYTQIKGEKKKLYKLYTDPTFNLAFRWFTARYEMYSLCFKLYTNYTQNPTLNPTQRRPKLYTRPHKTLHNGVQSTSTGVSYKPSYITLCWSLKSPSL